DYENNLKRHKELVTYLDRAVGRFKEGEASRVVENKLTIKNMIEPIDNQLKQKPEDSPYFQPVKSFPDGIGEADKARLTSEYRAAVTGELYPALTRLRDFLKDEYLGHARDGVGLMYMKGGDKLYASLLQPTPTLPLTADEIHQTGLSEVARITSEMEKV